MGGTCGTFLRLTTRIIVNHWHTPDQCPVWDIWWGRGRGMASGQLRPLPRLVTTGAHIGGEEDRTELILPFRLSLLLVGHMMWLVTMCIILVSEVSVACLVSVVGGNYPRGQPGPWVLGPTVPSLLTAPGHSRPGRGMLGAGACLSGGWGRPH